MKTIVFTVNYHGIPSGTKKVYDPATAAMLIKRGVAKAEKIAVKKK